MRDWTEALLLLANALDAADLALLPGIFRVLEVDLGAGPASLSALVLAQSMLKGLGYPVWGYLADRRPRRPLLGLACLGWGVAALGIACAASFTMLAVLLGAGGLALACLAPLSQSMLSDMAAPARRGAVFGRVRLAADLGAMTGATASTALSVELFFRWAVPGGVRGWRLPFAAVGLLSLAMLPAIRHGLVSHGRSSRFHAPLLYISLGIIQVKMSETGPHDTDFTAHG
jgi:MFS family permease